MRLAAPIQLVGHAAAGIQHNRRLQSSLTLTRSHASKSMPMLDRPPVANAMLSERHPSHGVKTGQAKTQRHHAREWEGTGAQSPHVFMSLRNWRSNSQRDRTGRIHSIQSHESRGDRLPPAYQQRFPLATMSTGRQCDASILVFARPSGHSLIFTCHSKATEKGKLCRFK